MSIRAIAMEVYRAQKNVDALVKKIEAAAQAQKEELERELRHAKHELAVLRKMLEGKKDTGERKRTFF